jgi:hypothetical protein
MSQWQVGLICQPLLPLLLPPPLSPLFPSHVYSLFFLLYNYPKLLSAPSPFTVVWGIDVTLPLLWCEATTNIDGDGRTRQWRTADPCSHEAGSCTGGDDRRWWRACEVTATKGMWGGSDVADLLLDGMREMREEEAMSGVSSVPL